MARQRKFLLFPVCLSVKALAQAMQVSPARINRAVRLEGLPLHVLGPRSKRILIEDAVKWVRAHPRELRNLKKGADNGSA